MPESSVYLFSEVDQQGSEARRLNAQASLFAELEWPHFGQGLARQGQVADFGCGSGSALSAIAVLRPDLELWGSDADPKALQATAEALHGVGARAQLNLHTLGSGRDLACPPLDLALCRLLLLHVPDPRACVAEMARTLKPGGLLALIDTDDTLLELKPRPVWQDRLLELMEQVQNSKGGSRRRGRLLPAYLSEIGLVSEGFEIVDYSTRRLGRSGFAATFAPVAAAYLDLACQAAWIDSDDAGALKNDISADLSRPGFVGAARFCIAWGRRVGRST